MEVKTFQPLKSKCIFCKKSYQDIIRHEDNCEKQFNVLIGPDYEQVKCKLCNRKFYKDTVIKWEYRKNKLYEVEIYGVIKHLTHRHKLKEDLESNYEPIINKIEIDEIKQELKEIPSNLKTIKDFSNYMVSDNGEVFNQYGLELKHGILSYGGHRVYLCQDGVREAKMIHYLVAEAFIDNPNDFKYVIHKDGDINNNHYSNLEWSEKRYKK